MTVTKMSPASWGELKMSISTMSFKTIDLGSTEVVFHLFPPEEDFLITLTYYPYGGMCAIHLWHSKRHRILGASAIWDKNSMSCYAYTIPDAIERIKSHLKLAKRLIHSGESK
ncbi:hypothetical protein [Schleiferilactobacillus perolens]|jgi:hypothetical protein|uniref:hypothetical protein n=1 Tax=Schleiferilactobacillus perolens TaxID=100468 RepID=UPI000709B64C|nr:hypothetical protein [Schleiferilactobacillus perolens]MCI2172172.1 hypothetical protein [Schleiferilactobacillus perolens]